MVFLLFNGAYLGRRTQPMGEETMPAIVEFPQVVSEALPEFADTTDQSCLNKFINYVAWDEELINERRLKLMQRDEATRYSDQGVTRRHHVVRPKY